MLSEGLRNVGNIALEMAPVTGEILSARDAFEGFQQGDVGQTLLGVLGAIPGAGVVGRVGKKGLKLSGRITNALPGRRAILEQSTKAGGKKLDIIYQSERHPDIFGGKSDIETVVDFAIDGSFDPSNLNMKSALDVLSTVSSSLDDFIRVVAPSRLVFSASRPDLAPLYSKVTDRIAKKHGGVVRAKGEANMIDFPDAPKL